VKIYARRLNPNVKVIAKQVKIDETTIDEGIDPETDLIIDTFDKWASRSLVNRFAVKHKILYLMAGVVSNCFYTALLHFLTPLPELLDWAVSRSLRRRLLSDSDLCDQYSSNSRHGGLFHR